MSLPIYMRGQKRGDSVITEIQVGNRKYGKFKKVKKAKYKDAREFADRMVN